MELLGTVTISKYVRLINLAEKRRAAYYEKGKKKLPDKLANQIGVNLEWNIVGGKTLLCDAEGSPVLANPNTAGKPRGYVITGNDIWSLRMLEAHKSKVVKAIKEQMITEVEKLDVITKFPIRILCELHDTVEEWMYITKDGKPSPPNWDIDNRSLFYSKTFPDVLQGTPMIIKSKIKGEKGKMVKTSKEIIPDDSITFITQAPVPLFFPIDNTDDRKLVFKIYHDDRDIIKNHSAYGNRGSLL